MGTGVMTPRWDRLGELKMPVTLIVGEHDEKFRAIGDRMALALPDARVVVVPGAGHAAHLEAPHAVAEAIELMAKADAIEFEFDGHTIRLTSEDRVYFPDVDLTKGDVFRYFLSVGDGILRAVRDRPTALERWPKRRPSGHGRSPRSRPVDPGRPTRSSRSACPSGARPTGSRPS